MRKMMRKMRRNVEKLWKRNLEEIQRNFEIKNKKIQQIIEKSQGSANEKV